MEVEKADKEFLKFPTEDVRHDPLSRICCEHSALQLFHNPNRLTDKCRVFKWNRLDSLPVPMPLRKTIWLPNPFTP